MEASVIFSQLIQMFLMMFLGGVLRKLRLLDQAFTGKLTTLLLNVTMPCLTFHSVMEQMDNRDFASAGIAAFMGAVMYVVLPLLALGLVCLLRFPKEQRGLYAFMLTYSNVGFMGFPLVKAVFGESAVFYTAIINIAFNISCFTIGIILMYHGREQQVKLSPRQLLTPSIILSLLAVLMYLLAMPFPDEIISVVGSIGDMTTPLAMLCIGSVLAAMPLKEVVGDWRVYLFSLIKQVILPLCLLPLLHLTLRNQLLLGIGYLLILTPVGNTAVLFATQHDGDASLAARGVFISTILSLVTIPLLVLLL